MVQTREHWLKELKSVKDEISIKHYKIKELNKEIDSLKADKYGILDVLSITSVNPRPV